MGLECGSGYSSIVATKTKFPLILAERVILDLKSGVYYGQCKPGFESIQEPKTLNEIQVRFWRSTRLSLSVVLTNLSAAKLLAAGLIEGVMKRLGKFLQLTRSERRLLLSAALLLEQSG